MYRKKYCQQNEEILNLDDVEFENTADLDHEEECRTGIILYNIVCYTVMIFIIIII